VEQNVSPDQIAYRKFANANAEENESSYSTITTDEQVWEEKLLHIISNIVPQ